MRRGWRWSLAGVAGLMVAVSLFVIPALGEGPVTGEVGTLHLQMDSGGDKFVLESGTLELGPQYLYQSNCKLSAASLAGPLVEITVTGTAGKRPYAGLKDHRIGVGQNGEGNGEPCARINGSLGQSLTLSLASADLGAIGYAEIDLGFKFEGNATLELFRDGEAEPFQTVPVECNPASDCGPDSGGSDNVRVVLWLDPDDDPCADVPACEPEELPWEVEELTDTFDTIVIRPGPAGVVSLEGGYNSEPGPQAGDTMFKLVDTFDGEIDCGETATLGGGDDPTFSITRGNDTDGGCKGPVDGLLYDFDSGEEGDRLFVDFVTAPVDGSAVAQFLEVITWEYASPPDVDPPASDPQQRTLSYDDNGPVDPPGERVMPWCLKDPRPLSTTSQQAMPTGHTSCLIESRTGYVTALWDILDHPLGTFLKVDVVYNIGDGKRWT